MRTDPFNNALPPNMIWRDGVYYVLREIRGRLIKRSTRKRDYKSALRRYHEIMKELNDGASGWGAPKNVTFGEYWREHYRPAYTIRKTPIKEGVYRDDQLIVSALKEFDRRYLGDITKTMIQRWANARRKETYIRKEGGVLHTIAESTVTREISFLQALFEQAKEDGLIEKNPCKKVEREDYATKERVLTVEEQEKLLAHLSPKFQRFVLFMLGTGLRLDEARGIDESRDLNLAERWVRVTRKTRGLKKKLQDIPLFDDDLIEVIEEQLKEEGVLWHQNPQRLREVLQQGCQKAGIAHISPHTLRHTFATRYLKAGGDIYKLSKLMGHSSVSVTEKVYAHLLTEDLFEASKHIRMGLKRPEGKVIEFKREA